MRVVRVCVWVCLACAVPSAAAAQGRQALSIRRERRSVLANSNVWQM